MDDKDRLLLIDYRMQQADETIQLAEFLVNNDKLTVAVNRIYYGMYYALSALALKHDYETSKHRQLIGWFNKEFVSSGRTDVWFGRILRSAFQNRTKGDYDAFVEFSVEEVSLLLTEMSHFISEIKKLLRD